jgi:hypothetical protein
MSPENVFTSGLLMEMKLSSRFAFIWMIATLTEVFRYLPSQRRPLADVTSYLRTYADVVIDAVHAAMWL